MKKVITICIALLLLAVTDPAEAAAGYIAFGDEAVINPRDICLKLLDDRGYTEKDLDLLSAAMQLENGCNSDLCLLYTGSVILNRTKRDWFPDTIEGVLLQKGQYASRTVKNLYTTRADDRVYALAVKLILHGSIDDEIIFQSQYKNLGHVKYIVDGEYFATE